MRTQRKKSDALQQNIFIIKEQFLDEQTIHQHKIDIFRWNFIHKCYIKPREITFSEHYYFLIYFSIINLLIEFHTWN